MALKSFWLTALLNICSHSKDVLQLTKVISMPEQDYDNNNNDDSKDRDKQHKIGITRNENDE